MEELENVRKNLYKAIEEGGLHSKKTQDLSIEFNRIMNLQYLKSKQKKREFILWKM